ncbi:MAG: PQQ-binding-like beta-propeller repeat protein [candidate division KSB1 bacterium]|nr:PQQ-binding-like beta-propeller repeat protein [candidate division KSB1 bacterium]
MKGLKVRKSCFPSRVLLLSGLLAGTISCSKFIIKTTERSERNWTQFGGTPTRTNLSPETIPLPLELAWTFKATSAIGPSLIVIDGVVYFGTLDGKVFAVNITTGEKLEQKKMDLESTCAFHEGYLLIARRYGEETLYCLDLSTGKFKWEINAGDIASEPLIANGWIYISALYKHVDRYSLTTGSKSWSYETQGQCHSSPALAGQTLVVGCDDGTVYALNENTGKLIWKYQTKGAIYATPAIWKDKVFIGSLDRTFYALNLAEGSLSWKYATSGQIYQSCAVNEEFVLFGSNDYYLYCLNQNNGQLQWRYQAKSLVSTSPLIAGDKVFFGSLDHHYYCLSLKDGQLLWSYKTRGRVRTSPVIWQGYLLGASEDNYLYAFKKADSFKN